MRFGNNDSVNRTEFGKYINASFGGSDDILTREITSCGIECALYYADGLSDKLLLEQDIIRPLLASTIPPSSHTLQQIVLFGEEIKPVLLEDCPQSIADGDIILFIDGEDRGYLISLRKFDKRAIVEPPTSTVLKGPREGFIEEIKTNVTLLRRRLKSPDFTVKMLKAGRYSSTSVALAYISGIADDEIVNAIEKKISAIDIDGIIDSTYIATFIQSRKHSIFNQTGSSEKPDAVAAKLLEGRIAIIVDGSPVVLTVPFVLLEDLQDPYDYYSNDWRAVMVRIFRILGAALTILLPGAYVALQSYHYHLLPLKFLMTLLTATSGIPFPPAIEMLIVLVLFEILNQASVRMPRLMGISLSIVGAIVLGDTAVKAGLISSPAVLVTALSAIGIFCVPDQVGTLSILRFLLLCISAVLGLFGIMIMSMLIICYLVGLENFGTPYLAPFAPRISSDLKDAILKQGTDSMIRRPYTIPNKNRVRLNKKED